MISPFCLKDTVALVTGAAGGIGAATARLLADAGAALVLSDRGQRSDALASELRASGHDVAVIPCDVSEPDAAAELGRQALALHGHVDVLVCAAGIQGPIGQATPADIDRVLTVNLKSVMALTAVLAPAMAGRGGGSIVLVASIAGLRGNRSIGLYGLSKAALSQLARNLAVEWGPDGVRANAISPGLIDTPFAASIKDDTAYFERRLGLTPLRRMGTADEIAASIVFLSSPAAGFVTGHNLVVDGGTTISDGN